VVTAELIRSMGDEKMVRTEKRIKRLSKATLYRMFVKPGDIAFQKGEKVGGFSI
jgi:hypothetical protein